jgi:hypothetical protein
MKNLWLPFIVTCMLGCESKDIQLTQYDLGANISCLQNESVLVTDSKGLIAPFTVTITMIADSRCPTGADCIVEGQASVNFGIEKDSFQLQTGQSRELVIHGQPLEIMLIDVTPYPTGTNGNQKKSAVFIFERL